MAFFYHQHAPGKYEYGGTYYLSDGKDKALREKIVSEMRSGRARTIKPEFNDLSVAGQRFQAMPSR